MRLVILNGRLIDPANKLDKVADLYIADGHIVGHGSKPDGFVAEQTLDTKGKIVIPGLIDLSARLREPGQEHKGNIASETRAAAARATRYGLLLLLSLWLVWGTSWPAMRIVFTEVPVWQFRAVSCAISGLALLAIAVAAGERWRVPRRHWGVLIAVSVFNMIIWQVCVGYGLSMLGAGHGAIITYTLPVWTAAISIVVLKERLTWRKALAVVLGVAGVLVLLASDFDAIGTSPLGALFMLAAAIGWAIGTIITKRVAWTIGMYTLAGWQLLISWVPMTAISALPFKKSISSFSLTPKPRARGRSVASRH